MQVELLTMSQDMDLEDGSITHFIVVRLPTGVVIKALISDESAKQVIHAKVTGQPAPVFKEAAPSSPESSPADLVLDPQAQGGDLIVFGGDGLGPGVSIPVPNVHPLPEKPRLKATRVEADALGYPILRTANGRDANEVTGSRDPDEDGVSQL